MSIYENKIHELSPRGEPFSLADSFHQGLPHAKRKLRIILAATNEMARDLQIPQSLLTVLLFMGILCEFTDFQQLLPEGPGLIV
jgi:hypothetical protein